MIIKKSRLFVFVNSVFLFFLLSYFFGSYGFLKGLAINLMVFILPGLVWVAVFKDKFKDLAVFIFYVVLFSIFSLLLGIALFWLIGHHTTALSFFAYIFAITNLGFVKFKTLNIPRKYLKDVLGVAALAYLALFYGASHFPFLWDNDNAGACAAHGLIYELTPYCSTDSPPISLANPPVFRFQSAYSLLLSKNIDKARMYHERIFFEDNRIVGDTSFTKDWELNLATRAPSIFFGMLVCVALFLFGLKLVGSKPLSLFSVFLLLSIPGVYVRYSIFAYSAVDGFCLLIMAYLFTFYNGRKDYYPALFLSGLFSALIHHKTAILPIAIILKYLFQNKSAKQKLRAVFSDKIIWGFCTGYVLWVIYGFWVNAAEFIRDHFIEHGAGRFIGNLGVRSCYHSLYGLWHVFGKHLGFPLLFLAIFSIAVLSVHHMKPRGIMLFWFLSGAVIFSIIDWRQTKHFMWIILPMVISILLLLSGSKGKKTRGVLWAVLLFAIIRNLYVIIKLLGNLNYLSQACGW